MGTVSHSTGTCQSVPFTDAPPRRLDRQAISAQQLTCAGAGKQQEKGTALLPATTHATPNGLSPPPRPLPANLWTGLLSFGHDLRCGMKRHSSSGSQMVSRLRVKCTPRACPHSIQAAKPAGASTSRAEAINFPAPGGTLSKEAPGYAAVGLNPPCASSPSLPAYPALSSGQRCFRTRSALVSQEPA
jgi:hypothetical protein